MKSAFDRLICISIKKFDTIRSSEHQIKQPRNQQQHHNQNRARQIVQAAINSYIYHRAKHKAQRARANQENAAKSRAQRAGIHVRYGAKNQPKFPVTDLQLFRPLLQFEVGILSMSTSTISSSKPLNTQSTRSSNHQKICGHQIRSRTPQLLLPYQRAP
jgi:hypothetical protein